MLRFVIYGRRRVRRFHRLVLIFGGLLPWGPFEDRGRPIAFLSVVFGGLLPRGPFEDRGRLVVLSVVFGGLLPRGPFEDRGRLIDALAVVFAPCGRAGRSRIMNAH